MFQPRWARMVWGATIAGVMAFVACSFYPMWRAYPVNAWCITGCNGSLWRMLLEMNDPEMVIEWQDGMKITTVAVHIAAIAGALIGGIRWKRKLADRETDMQDEPTAEQCGPNGATGNSQG